MKKINIKTPTIEQTNTLIEYLTKARMELTKLESIRREEERLGLKDTGNEEASVFINDGSKQDIILALFAWLTTISSVQEKLFMKNEED